MMVFAIGQRVLPAFCGMKILFSPTLMLWSLLLLNLGCALRVVSEIPAYEGYSLTTWRVLPISALTKLVAVSLFAFNIAPINLEAQVKISITLGNRLGGCNP